MAYTFFILGIASGVVAILSKDDLRMWSAWGVPVLWGLSFCWWAFGPWWGIAAFAVIAFLVWAIPRAWRYLWSIVG